MFHSEPATLLSPINLHLIFEKSSWMSLIFTACVARKNQVRNRQKIKFKNQVQNQFREIEILKTQVQIDRGSDTYIDDSVRYCKK